MAQRMELRVSPDVRDAEVIFTGCEHGPKRQTVLVPRWALKGCARMLIEMRETIAGARQRESLPGNSHTMGMRSSSMPIGAQGASCVVRGFGPNREDGEWRDGQRVEDVAGKLRVQIRTKRRGYPAFDVIVDEAGAQAIVGALWDASQPPGVTVFEWEEPS